MQLLGLIESVKISEVDERIEYWNAHLRRIQMDDKHHAVSHEMPTVQDNTWRADPIEPNDRYVGIFIEEKPASNGTSENHLSSVQSLYDSGDDMVLRLSCVAVRRLPLRAYRTLSQERESLT